MTLPLFDLHCDTAYEMRRRNQSLVKNTLAVSLKRAKGFSRYTQVMALWTDRTLSDEEGWTAFEAMLTNLKSDPSIACKAARIVTDYRDTSDSPTLILAVEDARILAGNLSRVGLLWDAGVRILTPLWKGETSIGGSHDTDTGLTEFGHTALKSAVELGMILDISHASVQSADEIFELSRAAGRPVIASHSNSHAICPVSRNLSDRQVRQIIDCDGLIGLNLYGAFLSTDRDVTARDLLPHIEHFLSLGAKDILCLGCDMDGCTLPPDIPTLDALPRLADYMLAHGYSESLVQAIFWENANRFAKRYLTT